MGTLYVALELGQDKWLLACATQAAEKPRFRPVPARDLDRLVEEIAKAKARFGLPDDGLHSPNEKYRLDNYYKGIMTIAHFFEELGGTTGG